MQPQAAYIFLGALLASAAIASPTIRSSQGCQPHADSVHNPFGNVVIEFSDNIVHIGDLDPSVELQKIPKLCSTAGGCNDKTWTAQGMIPGNVKGGKILSPHQFEFHTEGIYPPWIRNGLYQVLMTAVGKADNVTQEKYFPPAATCGRYGCIKARDLVAAHMIPDYIAVYWYDPNDCDAVPAHMSIATAAVDPKGAGFCSTLATIAGTVGGVVEADPMLNGLFSLVGLACSLNGA